MRINLSIRTSFKSFRMSKGQMCIFLCIFILLALINPILPDYTTYQEMYESGGGHLAVTGRDIGFVLLIQATEPLINYDQFRRVVLLLIAILTIWTLRNLQAISSSRFSMSLAIALPPLS